MEVKEVNKKGSNFSFNMSKRLKTEQSSFLIGYMSYLAFTSSMLINQVDTFKNEIL